MKRMHKCLVIVACLIMAMTAIGLVGCNKTKVESVSLNKTSITLNVGASETLTATVLPKEAKQDVTWSVDKTDVATVDDNGKVTAVKVGTAKVTVTTKDGNKTAECTVNVVDQVDLTADMIKLSQDTMTFTGSELKPTVTITANEKTVDAGDYDVAYENNINAGTAKVKVTPKSTSTVIKGAAVEKEFTINPADAAANDFTVEVEKDVVDTEGATAKQAPTAKFKKGSDTNSYTLKDNEYTVKYYADNSDTAITKDDDFARYTKISVEVIVKKDGNFKFTDNTKDLVLTKKEYNIGRPAGEAGNFFSVSKGDVTVNDGTFKNDDTFAISRDTTSTETGYELYKATGKAAAFTDDNAAKFGGVTVRDDYVILTFDNKKNTQQVKVGWVNEPNDKLVSTTASDKTASLGYKEFTDYELILWATRPGRTNYFRVEIGDKAYVLDMSEVTTQDFIKVNDQLVYIGTGNETDTKKGFQNGTGNNGITIEKEGDIYKISGNAVAFTDDNKTEFNASQVDKFHSYVVLKLNIKPVAEANNAVKYNSGWVATPDEKLVATDGTDGSPKASVGYKEHTVTEGNDDLVLWVTRPEASSLKYFRFELDDRAYVLDITNLKTGSNIFSSETREVDKDGKTESTAGNGFKNKTALTFEEEGNIIKVKGNSTKFTSTNKDKYGDNGTGIKENTDEYIVLKFSNSTFSNIKKYKCAWVSDPNAAFESNYAAHEFSKTTDNGSLGDNGTDLTLTMWVTRPGISGKYFRLEIENENGDSNKALRAYVLDLSELKKEGSEEYVYDFFKVKSESDTLGSKNFQNKADNNFKIERVSRNVWKATGKATKFTNDNKSAFSSVVKETDAYIVMTLDTADKASVTMGWVKNVGDEIDKTDGNKDKTGYKTVEVKQDRETFIIWTTRTDKTGNIFCVEISGVRYYLDCTELGVEGTN